MAQKKGHVVSVNGNMVNVRFEGDIVKNEVAYIKVGDTRLKSEVIRISDGVASMQVYEMTTGVGVGDEVEFSGELLSVELGPGLLSQVYDGLQNDLEKIERVTHPAMTRVIQKLESKGFITCVTAPRDRRRAAYHRFYTNMKWGGGTRRIIT